MRFTTVVLCFGILYCSPAVAQDAFFFRGVFSIVSKNQACVGRNPVGDAGIIRLSVAADGGASAFALYQPNIAQAFRLEGGLFNASYRRVQSLTTSARFASVRHSVLVRFAQQRPTAIGANTSFVSFVGFIKGYGARAECVVAFRAALTKNID